MVKAKLEADKPAGEYQNIPYTIGKGRFGPFIKWGELFVNIPARIAPDKMTPAQAVELIEAKIEKEGNRYIHLWEAEKISVENGRWGPYIKFGKNNLKLPRINGAAMTADYARSLTLEDVKKIIEAEMPGVFDKKEKKGTKG